MMMTMKKMTINLKPSLLRKEKEAGKANSSPPSIGFHIHHLKFSGKTSK